MIDGKNKRNYGTNAGFAKAGAHCITNFQDIELDVITLIPVTQSFFYVTSEKTQRVVKVVIEYLALR